MELSIWEKESFFAPRQVVIAGSGLVALWTAYFLKKKNPLITILILEKGLIPTGASTRNAGFACFGSYTELLEDSEKMGVDAMKELVEMRWAGLQMISSVLSPSTIDFDICGGYELLPQTSDPNTNFNTDRIDWLNNELFSITGEPATFRLADQKLKQFGFKGMKHLVENRLEGYLHSGKLCEILLQLVQGIGVTVLNNTEINCYEKQGDYVIIETSNGFYLQTENLIVCTNAYARQLIPELDIVPARGQVLLTAPLASLPFKGTFHFDQGYYYFRNLGNRVLLGGARNKAFSEEETSVFGISSTIQEELERFLKDVILPGQSITFTDRWSGIMAMGAEKLPIIRKIENGIFCAVRMSGMGVALAPQAGLKMAEMVLK